MKEFLIFFYHNPILAELFPTLVSCLQKELADCQTVLDLGCGADSPLQHCKNISFSVGVETFLPYLKESKRKKFHSKYLNKKIEGLIFPEKSFDSVILMDVLEHLPKKTGKVILKSAEKWARKKVILTTPNGFIAQRDIDQNPYQKHLSGWRYEEMISLGFRCNGLAGLKYLRTERPHNSENSDLTSSIRFKPRIFWFIIAALSQMITYHIPSLAFELFCVKRLKNTRTK